MDRATLFQTGTKLGTTRPSDEGRLIEQARQREPAALSELYRRHVDAIYRYIYYRVSDAETAEDLTAEVFMRMVESIDRYTDHGIPISAWLYRIAHARIIDHWRRNQRRPQVEWSDALVSAHLVDDLPQKDVVALQRLREALGALKDEQQQVILFKFLEGLDNQTVAQIMNKTEGAVKALQHRALAALARTLDDEQDHEA